jgi:hypothetical protein
MPSSPSPTITLAPMAASSYSNPGSFWAVLTTRVVAAWQGRARGLQMTCVGVPIAGGVDCWSGFGVTGHGVSPAINGFGLGGTQEGVVA